MVNLLMLPRLLSYYIIKWCRFRGPIGLYRARTTGNLQKKNIIVPMATIEMVLPYLGMFFTAMAVS